MLWTKVIHTTIYSVFLFLVFLCRRAENAVRAVFYHAQKFGRFGLGEGIERVASFAHYFNVRLNKHAPKKEFVAVLTAVVEVLGFHTSSVYVKLVF